MRWRPYVESSLRAHDANLKAKSELICRLDDMIHALELRVRNLENREQEIIDWIASR